MQDVIQLGPLATTLAQQMLGDPLFVPQILAHVGPGPLADWLLHFLALTLYTVLHTAFSPLLGPLAPRLPPRQRFLLRRTLEAWRYGSGLDYELEK